MDDWGTLPRVDKFSNHHDASGLGHQAAVRWTLEEHRFRNHRGWFRTTCRKAPWPHGRPGARTALHHAGHVLPGTNDRYPMPAGVKIQKVCCSGAPSMCGWYVRASVGAGALPARLVLRCIRMKKWWWWWCGGVSVFQ
jgi:hypothetical protein